MSDECDILRAENERLKVAVLHLFKMAAKKNDAGETMLLHPYCRVCIDAENLVESLRREMKK